MIVFEGEDATNLSNKKGYNATSARISCPGKIVHLSAMTEMATSWRISSHERWLRKNIKEDDRLIKKYRGSITILEDKRQEIHSLMDLFSNFTLGADGRFMIGQKEFQLAMLEDSMDKVNTYLQHLDEHFTFLAIQALMLGKARDLERVGYKIDLRDPGETDVD
jgi:hypothetical protein